MAIVRSVRYACGLVGLCVVSAAAQSGGQMPPMPKPGPEHALFKTDAGTWDAVVEVAPAPGAPAQKSTGVEVNTVGCGGLCLITDFKGQMMGTPFHGHGVMTWDAAKKKYVGTWTDSMSVGMSITEATYDTSSKKFTGSMEGPDMTGQIVKSRSVSEHRNASTRVMTMYSPGPDGKEKEMLKITYTRRK